MRLDVHQKLAKKVKWPHTEKNHPSFMEHNKKSKWKRRGGGNPTDPSRRDAQYFLG